MTLSVLDGLDPRTRRNFRRDFTASLLGGVFDRATSPFIALIAARDLHLSPVYISAIVTAPVVANLFALQWVKLAHGMAKLRVVVWSLTASRLMLIPLVFGYTAHAYVVLVCLSFLLGVIAVPAYSGICKAVYPERARGAILAHVRAAPLLTGIPTALAAGWLLNRLGHLGPRSVFPVAALVGIAALRVYSRIEMPPENDSDAPRPGIFDSLKILACDRRFRSFTIAVSTFGIGNLLAGPIYTLYQGDILRVSNQQQGVLCFVSASVMLVSFVLWGKLVDRIGSRRCLTLAVFLVFLQPFAYYLAHSAWGLIPAFAIEGVAFSGIQLTYLTSILGFASDRDVPRYQAVHTTLLGARGLVAAVGSPLLLRLLAPTADPVRTAFLVCGGIIFVGFMLQLVTEIGAHFSNS